MILDLPDQGDLIVAVDTEGSGLHPDDGARLSMVTLAWSGGTRVYFFDQGAYTWLGPKQLPRKYPGPTLFEQDRNLGWAEWEQLTEWLARQQLVFHNATHDLTLFDVGLRGAPGTGVDLSGSYLWDTMVVAPLLWPNERVGLDALGAIVLGRGKEHVRPVASWRKRYLGSESAGRYDLIPTELVEPYARQDPEMTLDLYLAEMALIGEGVADWEAVDREVDLARVLFHMQRAGIGFDTEQCRQQDRRLNEMEAHLDDQVAEIVGRPHPTEAVMRRYWFDELGINPVKLTGDGKSAVSADVVRELAANHVPAAEEWQQLTKVRTARKMWYGPWPDLAGPDGRLRTVFRQTKSSSDIRDESGPDRGTRSGRLAVERVQMQAIPHDYQIPAGIVPLRKMFQARAGYAIVEVDVSQAEMRAVAGLARCQSLIERFAAGDDAHSATAQLVFEAGPGDPQWDFLRNVAKRLNFGIVYGAGIPTLCDQIRLWTGYEATEAEVEVWWSAAKRSMPEIFAMSRALRRQADETGAVPLVGGRMRYFAPYEFTHKALNARIQGSVAVAMADAMIEIHRRFGPGVLLLQIHDSVVVELLGVCADDWTAIIRNIICQTFERLFGIPFKADSKVWAASPFKQGGD